MMKNNRVNRLIRIFSAVMCAVMLTLSVSAAGDDAYALYTECVKKMDKTVTSMEIRSTTKITASMQGKSAELSKTTSIIRMMMTQNNRLEFQVESVDDEGNKAHTYYKSGVLYMNNGKSKIKLIMNLEEAMSLIGKSELNIGDGALKELLSGARIEKVDGGRRIHYETSMSAANNPTLTALAEEFKKEDSDINISFSKVNSTFTIGDDDLQKAYASVCSMKISADSNSMTVKQNTNGRILSYNTVESINFPDDLNTYKSMMY